MFPLLVLPYCQLSMQAKAFSLQGRWSHGLLEDPNSRLGWHKPMGPSQPHWCCHPSLWEGTSRSYLESLWDLSAPVRLQLPLLLCPQPLWAASFLLRTRETAPTMWTHTLLSLQVPLSAGPFKTALVIPSSLSLHLKTFPGIFCWPAILCIVYHQVAFRTGHAPTTWRFCSPFISLVHFCCKLLSLFSHLYSFYPCHDMCVCTCEYVYSHVYTCVHEADCVHASFYLVREVFKHGENPQNKVWGSWQSPPIYNRWQND